MTYQGGTQILRPGQTQIVSDFSPTATFTWVPHTVEGVYTFNVVARDITTAPFVVFAPVSSPFTLTPWVTIPLAAGAVNKTTHPWSHCSVLRRARPPISCLFASVWRTRRETEPNSMTTNLVPCATNGVNFYGDFSENVYIAGMYPSSSYLMHWEEYDGTTLVNTGGDLPFTTGALPPTFPAKTYTVNVPPQSNDTAYPVVLFQSSPYASATDLLGNVIWYWPNATSTVARMEPGGNFYAIDSGISEFDLVGNLVTRTNLEILNEQLIAKGYPPMNGLNGHEVRNLPDGNIVMIGQRIVVSTNAQGGTPAKPINIIGDEVVVLGPQSSGGMGIGRFRASGRQSPTDRFPRRFMYWRRRLPIATSGNDWLHTNAVQGTADGNIILSERNQDMVLKINYDKGKGDGSVIWRMGAGA